MNNDPILTRVINDLCDTTQVEYIREKFREELLCPAWLSPYTGLALRQLKSTYLADAVNQDKLALVERLLNHLPSAVRAEIEQRVS